MSPPSTQRGAPLRRPSIGKGWCVSVVDSGEFGDVSPDFWFENKKDANALKKEVFNYLKAFHSSWDNLDQMVDAPVFKAIAPDR